MSFTLWDRDDPNHEGLGVRIGPELDKPQVVVRNGLFKVELDFEAEAFNGEERWLQIKVKCDACDGCNDEFPADDDFFCDRSRFVRDF